MSWFTRKPRGRYYLLPGMGGKLARKKGLWALKISLSIGIVVALIVGLIIYYANKPTGSSLFHWFD